MRKLMFALAVVLTLLAVLSSVANAGAFSDPTPRKGQLAIGLTGGLAQPVGQLGRDVNVAANVGENGLNLAMGFNGGGFADYYFTDRFALGALLGTGTLHMKDLTVGTGSGARTYENLVEGRTIIFGGYAKFFAEPKGAWAPFAYVGAARFNRKAQLSRDVLELHPGTTVFEIVDNKIGMVGGLGVDYSWKPTVTFGVVGSYDYSGHLAHQFPWMGHQSIVHDWSFLTVHAQATWYVGKEE